MASRVPGLVLRHFSTIRLMLDKTPEAYQPALLDSTPGRIVAEDWARGFFAAVTLRGASWAALLVPEQFGLIAPIAVHWSNQEGLPLVPGSVERTAEIQQKAVGLLPAAVIAIDQFWKGRAKRSPDRRQRLAATIPVHAVPERSTSDVVVPEHGSTPVGSVRFHVNPLNVFSCVQPRLGPGVGNGVFLSGFAPAYQM